MKKYERPMVFVNEELAEGVYAASGIGPVGDITYSIVLAQAGNPNHKVNIYDVTVKNNSAEVASSWTVSLKVVEGMATNAQVYNGWMASASLQGDTITVTPGGGGSIQAGDTLTVQVVVSYGGDSVRVQ